MLYSKDGQTLVLYAVAKDGWSFVVPDGVKYIDGESFSGCNLKRITIPAGVTSIGASAFSKCKIAEVINYSSLDIKAGDSSDSYEYGYLGQNALEVHSGLFVIFLILMFWKNGSFL